MRFEDVRAALGMETEAASSEGEGPYGRYLVSDTMGGHGGGARHTDSNTFTV